MSKRQAASPSGNGKTSPFGTTPGGASGSNGGHDFVKEPTNPPGDGPEPIDFAAQSRRQDPKAPAPTNTAPYLEGRKQVPGSAEQRTNPRDAGAGGVGKMPGDVGNATKFDAQQGQRGAPVQRPPFKGLR